MVNQPVEEQDLKAYLASKGVQFFGSAGAEISTWCFACEPGETHGKGKLYFNTELWLGHCFRCDLNFNRHLLLEHFGDADGLRFAPGSDPSVRLRILAEAAGVAHEMLLGNDTMAGYLLDRGISEELIVEQRLGFVPANVGLSDMLPSRESFGYKDIIGAGLLRIGTGGKEFFNDSLVIPYWSHGAVIGLRAKDLGGHYRTVANDRSRLYNGDALLGAIEALVVEGEYDCLSIRSCLARCTDRRWANLAVVAVPGAGSWPDGLVEDLSRCRRAFVGFDPDETGEQFSTKLVAEVGSNARRVVLPGTADWSDWLRPKTPASPEGGHDWTDVVDLLVEADLAGKRIFSVGDALTKWRRLRTERPGIKTGWPSMDTILRPGLKPGQVMIPLAATGAGKSVFLSNLAHNVSRHGVLYVSLELTASEVFEHLRRIHRFWNPTAGQAELLADYDRVHIVEQNRIGPGLLGDYIAEYVEEVGRRPEVVIIDYLQYFARGFRGGSAYERVTDAVMEVKAVGKEEGVVMVIPSQVNRTAEHGKPLSIDHARDGGTIEETADFVLSLFRPDTAVDHDDPHTAPPATGTFSAQLLKSRHGGGGRLFNLRYSPLSLVIVDALDRKSTARVEQENLLARRGTHYEDYRAELDQLAGQDSLLGVAP